MSENTLIYFEWKSDWLLQETITLCFPWEGDRSLGRKSVCFC